MMRVGQGFDVHALVSGRPLILGGVRIPHSKGLQGHSDADALLHAICDACLGAAGLGDIGHHFPDSDNQYKDIDSRVLLRRVHATLTERGWKIINVDATVIAQVPKVAPHVPAMKTNIASDLKISAEQVSVKATTTERLGLVGREEGIVAQAVVLLSKE